ncbi:EamA-like transporter family protein [Roseovarius albus]|uniref:EamA-like transporter family protein n=2 Tax=Roseovarius albus TaxID=1247867 RepID=A0A1X6YCH5_9RHOB|nr:EamA-like transporter family protein [Roseovarius albus]
MRRIERWSNSQLADNAAVRKLNNTQLDANVLANRMTLQTSHRTSASPSYALAAIGVLFASICFGVVPFFARGLTEQGLAPHAVAFFRYVITAFVLLPVLIKQVSAWREVGWGMSAGAAMGLGWIGYVAAVEVAPASTVGVLYMTYPVFTVFLAWLLFGDTATRRALIASAMIFVAALIAGNPQVVPASQIPALIVSLAAPLGFGFGICVLVHRLSRIPPLARVASVSLGAMVALCPLMVVSEAQDVIPQTATVWVLVAGLAIVSALVPQLIYTICSPVIGTSRTAVFGSIELPTMFAVSILVFGEKLTVPQFVACVLILAAIALTQSKVTRNVSTNLSKS